MSPPVLGKTSRLRGTCEEEAECGPMILQSSACEVLSDISHDALRFIDKQFCSKDTAIVFTGAVAGCHAMQRLHTHTHTRIYKQTHCVHTPLQITQVHKHSEPGVDDLTVQTDKHRSCCGVCVCVCVCVVRLCAHHSRSCPVCSCWWASGRRRWATAPVDTESRGGGG